MWIPGALELLQWTVIAAVIITAAAILFFPRLSKQYYVIIFTAFIFVALYIFYATNVLFLTQAYGATENDVKTSDAVYATLPRVTSLPSERVVVSLTTIPNRIELIRPTVYSLLTQESRVDEIAVNIPMETRKGKTYVIPEWLSSLRNVKIHRFEPDFGPSSKLLPTLQREAPRTAIIVVDDDQVYLPGLVSSLATKFKDADGKRVYTNLGCTFEEHFDGKWLRFKSLLKTESVEKEFVFGYLGYVVAPEMFLPGVFDYSVAPKAVVTVDDDWISGWLRLSGTPIYTTGGLPTNRLAVPVYELSDTGLIRNENASNTNVLETRAWFDEKAAKIL